MKILKSQLFRQLTVLVLLIGIIVSSVVCTQASLYQVSGLFGSSARTNVFKNKTDNAGSVGDINSYPIKYTTDDIGPEFTQLGFDILLGTKRDMVSYTGEIPLKWKDREGLTLVPYSNYSAQSKEYWGIYSGPKGDQNIDEYWNFTEGQELAFVEEMAGEKDGDSGSSEVTSIRMYALTKSSSFSILDNKFSQFSYAIWQELCGLSAGILKIFIAVKNVSIAKVLEALNLDKLVKLFTKVLIQDSGHFSIFMIIAIISFIFAIVGYAINFARGKQQKQGGALKDILILFFCGITIVAMCIYRNPTTIGTSAANAVNKITTELVYDSVAGGHDLWQSKAKKSIINDSTEVSYNETTLINKTLIELQILNQFGVQDIEDLDIKNFHNVKDIGFIKLNNDGERDLTNFGNNLGYYYWFANSPSPEYKGNLTNTYRNGVYNSGKVDARLEAIMSYLQKAYTKASDDGDTKTKARILNIVDHFANPNTANGAVLYFLLTIEYVLLCLVLARLVLKILLGKLLISGSVLGLPVAGPLLITTKPKCVSAGKLILMTLVTYSIQVFVLSVLFDLVLNVIGVLIAPNILNILLAMAVTIGLHAFLPNLYRQLDRLFATINQSIGAGKITQYQNRASQAVSSRFNGLKGRTKTKTVTEYDADGNAVQVAAEQHTGLSKAATIAAAIGGYGDGNRGSNIRNIKKIDESSRTDRIERSKELANEMHRRTGTEFDNFNRAKQSRLSMIYGNAASTFDNINAEALSAEDHTEYTMIRGEYESILNDSRFKELQQKQAKIGLSADENIEYEQFNTRLGEAGNKRDRFNRRIQQDIHDQALAEHGNQVTTAIDNEVRTGMKAVDDATQSGKIFRFNKDKKMDNVAENITDSTHRELEELYQEKGATVSEKQLDKDRLSVALRTAGKKEEVNVAKQETTRTTTVTGSIHQQLNDDITPMANEMNKRRKRKIPFAKK